MRSCHLEPILWDITPCRQLKFNRRFGVTRRLHLQGGRVSQARNEHVASSKQKTSNPPLRGKLSSCSIPSITRAQNTAHCSQLCSRSTCRPCKRYENIFSVFHTASWYVLHDTRTARDNRSTDFIVRGSNDFCTTLAVAGLPEHLPCIGFPVSSNCLYSHRAL